MKGFFFLFLYQQRLFRKKYNKHVLLLQKKGYPSLIIFLLYFLFDKHQDNERMYKICKDQEETIQELQKAISLQQFYIKQLESITGLNYNK